MLTTYPDGTKVYTPFPDYEVTDPPTGSNVTRTTYRLAGGIVAIRKKEGTADTLYYPLTDHLGNVIALSDVHGNAVSGSDARYEPFGAFTTAPTTNPSISNHGFTGHRHNNTGANNLGLIYMNARYYLPEVGRFISQDTIVPDPSNPQSYNRYSYSYNSPLNLTDPSGHRPTSGCGENESGCTLDDELDPNQTYIDNNGSPVVADPMLLEQYPGDFTAEEAAWIAAGLLTAGAAPIVLEAGTGAVVAAWPALIGAGGAACADGDCGNEYRFATETSRRVFYSGGGSDLPRRAAEGWAKANNSVTIGMTKTGQQLEAMTVNMRWVDAKPLWAKTSAEFASGATGEVHVFLSSNIYPDGIWKTVELPILQASQAIGRVTSIIEHIID